MSELLPCPFCGGSAERIDIDDGENAGGSCISCTRCQASSNLEFGYKENFVSNWNRRAGPAMTPDNLREEVARIVDPWSFNQCEWASQQDNDEVLRAYLPKREAALAKADAILALPVLSREGWRPIETAPRDGTSILAFCVHPNARWAGEDFAEWTEIVTTRWIDHNGGGWTWNGLCGVHTHWMPLPPPPAARQALQQGEGNG